MISEAVLDRFMVFRVLMLVTSGIFLLGFLLQPTIDFDEGFFFQSAVHATQTGVPGFPWSDLYFGRLDPYIPLNSLLPLFNWPLAYLPAWMWLPAGRLVSAVAVVGALVILLFIPEEKMPANPIQYAIAAFTLLCHPLWLHGRMIRPEGLAICTFCAGIRFAQSPVSRAAFLAGITVGLTILAHTVHGSLAVVVVAACAAVTADTTTRQKWGRILLVGLGAFLPVAIFYGWYVNRVGFKGLGGQIEMFAALTPRSVSSFLPREQLNAWLSNFLSQLNVGPLLGVAALSLIAPVNSHDPKARTIRVFQAVVVAFMFFWIFAYPKKSFSPVVLLLPLSWLILRTVSFDGRRGKLILAGLCLCLVANCLIMVRYHWRLLHSDSGLGQLTPIATRLSEEGVLHPNARILTKLWLIFKIPPTVTVLDVTVLPPILGTRFGAKEGMNKAIESTDAVVLEWADDGWIDRLQAKIADYCRAQGWREMRVQTTRYFTPLDLVLFVPQARWMKS